MEKSYKGCLASNTTRLEGKVVAYSRATTKQTQPKLQVELGRKNVAALEALHGLACHWKVLE
jgi:hypothetical protein